MDEGNFLGRNAGVNKGSGIADVFRAPDIERGLPVASVTASKRFPLVISLHFSSSEPSPLNGTRFSIP